MRAVVQRVTRASVAIDGVDVGVIGSGLLLLLGCEEGDTESDLEYVVQKVANLRIFADDEGRMNRSVLETGGAVLVVSQFTLFGDVRKGRRPSFVAAMHPSLAAPMVDRAVDALRALGVEVATGRFGADMAVSLVNDGPVTLLIDSRKRF